MRNNVRLLLIMAILVLLPVLLAGCITIYKGDQTGAQPSTGVRSTTAPLSEATMCKSVDPKTAKPVQITNVFTPDDPVIYCSVRLSNAPPNTELKAQWYFSGLLDGIMDGTIHEDVGLVSGSNYVAIDLQRKTRWLVGNYEVRLFIDGQQKLVVPFKIQ